MCDCDVGKYTHRIDISWGSRICVIEACAECYREFEENQLAFIEKKKKTTPALETCLTTKFFY